MKMFTRKFVVVVMLAVLAVYANNFWFYGYIFWFSPDPNLNPIPDPNPDWGNPCGPKTSVYTNLSCRAEELNIQLGETALMPLSPQRSKMEVILHSKQPSIKCDVAATAIQAYSNKKYLQKKVMASFTRYRFDAATAASPLPRRLRGAATRTANTTQHLRVDDADDLLYLAGKAFSESKVWEAVFLSSLARTLVHGADNHEENNKEGGLLHRAIVDWNAYFKVAIDNTSPRSDDEPYVHKLSSCPKYLDGAYTAEAQQQEPFYKDGRNADYHQLNQLMSTNPYRVLPTFPSVQQKSQGYKRRILLDAGANDFFTSPKSLIDMYAPYMKFDEVHLFEPYSNGMNIPEHYNKNYNITFHRTFVTVGSRDASDIITFLESNFVKDDFVVLKFDVDAGVTPVSMEWGFLSDLLHSKALQLVDEFFIELHFFNPAVVDWGYSTRHSMQQQYDVFRQLRKCGLPIHSWP